MKQFKLLKQIATRLGFKGMKSFSLLYKGGTMNTFGHPENSMWTFTILLTTDDKICGAEIHSTYFRPTEQMNKLCEFATFKTPKTFEEVLEYFDKNNIK